MKVNPNDESYYWFEAHGLTEINPKNILRCNVCLRVIGRYELSDYEVIRGFICNICAKEDKF